MNSRFFDLVVFSFCLLGISASASQLTVGDAVPAFSAKDQHGEEFVFTNGVQFLLIAQERASGTSANQKLAEQGAGFLERHQAVFVMDIHTMPYRGPYLCDAEDAEVSPADCARGSYRNVGVGSSATGPGYGARTHAGGALRKSVFGTPTADP